MSDGERPPAIVVPAAAALVVSALITLAWERWDGLDWRGLALLSVGMLAAGPVALRPLFEEARARWSALQGERRGWLRGLAIVYGVLGVLALAWLLVWQVPLWQVPSGSERRLELVNEYRRTLAGVAGGITVLLTLAVAWRRAEAAMRQTRALEQGQLTERFTRAIDQLGAMKGKQRNVEVRLGGIYALEQVARDAPDKYHWQIMEVLSAYVRENHRFDDNPIAPNLKIPRRLDVQGALTVIGRRQTEQDTGQIDLKETDLRGYDLEGAHLEGANLWGAHLEGANLWEARLEGAELARAHLEGASLSEANLRGTKLMGAHLEGLGLVNAHLEGADLTGAHLERAYLPMAHLEEANLPMAHLEGADLEGANLEGANLWRANLEGANLKGANLKGANLKEAHRPQDDLHHLGWKADAEGVLHRIDVPEASGTVTDP